MSLLRSLSLGGAALIAVASVASAADMPGYPPLPAPTAPLHRTEIYSGWYLRGDLGYRWGISDGVQTAAGFPGLIDERVGNSFSAGLGGGIKTGWLRSDVTIDFGSPMKYEGTFAAPGDTTAKVSATTILWNGYFDLDSWYHVTPYIGGGVGTARVTIDDYGSTGAPAFANGASRSKWNFAWAAMAGVAYAISPNTMLDVGYRYVNFGDVTTGDNAVASATLKNVAAHEVRVGLRWSFDDLPIAR